MIIIDTCARGVMARAMPTALVWTHFLLTCKAHPALLAKAFTRLAVTKSITIAAAGAYFRRTVFALEAFIATTLALIAHAMARAVVGAEEVLTGLAK